MNIFNENHKELFLNKFTNENTKEVYKRIFLKSYEMEKTLNLDLYNFSDEDLEKFILKELKPSTKESARTYCNVLSSYITWAIDKRYSHHFTNPLKRRQDYFYNFVQDKVLYISYSQKEAILNSLMNAQDKIIIQALFEGIQGSQLSELVNLKGSDLKKGNGEEDYIDFYVEIDNNGVKKILPIEAKTYYIGKSANAEKDYYRKNGEVDYSVTVSETVSLPDSEYVLKGAKTNPNGDGKKVTHYTIYNRLEMIKNLEGFEEFSDALTTKNIVRSGMIYWAKRILERDGVLERKQLNEICARFGVKYKWSLGEDFLNREMVERLYPE